MAKKKAVSKPKVIKIEKKAPEPPPNEESKVASPEELDARGHSVRNTGVEEFLAIVLTSYRDIGKEMVQGLDTWFMTMKVWISKLECPHCNRTGTLRVMDREHRMFCIRCESELQFNKVLDWNRKIRE